MNPSRNDMWIRTTIIVMLLSACEVQMTGMDYEGFGEAFDTLGALPIEAVLAERDLYLEKQVSIEGAVHAVCQQAGCWLMLRSRDGENVRVDVERTASGAYVFTLPTDISGSWAVARGVLSVSASTKAEAAHLAKEGGEARLILRAEGVMIARG